jgi:hypothetical protein
MMNASVKFGGKSARITGITTILNKDKNIDPNSDLSQLFPLEPRKALESFTKYMLDFEKSEMLDYE